MTYEPIVRLDIENYGPIRKVSLALSPLHALIGPNDSGKSTILRALRTAAQFARGSFGADPIDEPRPFNPMLDPQSDGPNIGVHYADNLAYVLRYQHGVGESVYEGDQKIAKVDIRRTWNMPGLLQQDSPVPAVKTLAERLTTATMVRFDPDCLRAPAPLIPESKGIAFADERGTGLASVFDAILNRDAEAFAKIQAVVCGYFPSIARLGLINVSNSLKEIAVTLTDGTRVGAKAMSEGLLYFLGFLALKHVTGSRLLLIEEPENGLHPARIAETMAILRELSKESQVIMATHSPLVINELQGHEISVVTRHPQEGTQAILLRDTPNYAARSEIYLNGELWVAYGDGTREAALLDGTARPWVVEHPEFFK